MFLHNTVNDGIWFVEYEYGIAMNHGMAFADDGFGNYIQCSAVSAFDFTFSDGQI
jgi:hypothetical protein